MSAASCCMPVAVFDLSPPSLSLRALSLTAVATIVVVERDQTGKAPSGLRCPLPAAQQQQQQPQESLITKCKCVVYQRNKPASFFRIYVVFFWEGCFPNTSHTTPTFNCQEEQAVQSRVNLSTFSSFCCFNCHFTAAVVRKPKTP